MPVDNLINTDPGNPLSVDIIVLVKSPSTRPPPDDIAFANVISSTLPTPAVVLPNTLPVLIVVSSATAIPPDLILTPSDKI